MARDQHLLCKWQQIPRAPRGTGDLQAALGHPPPLQGSILRAPELGGTPKAPSRVQAQFHPHFMVLKSFGLSLHLLSRIIDREGIKENLSM